MASVFLEFRARFESFEQALRPARVAFMLSARDGICGVVQLVYNVVSSAYWKLLTVGGRIS